MGSIFLVAVGSNLLDVVSPLSNDWSGADLDSFGGLFGGGGSILIVVFLLGIGLFLFLEGVLLRLKPALLVDIFVILVGLFLIAVVHYGDRLGRIRGTDALSDLFLNVLQGAHGSLRRYSLRAAPSGRGRAHHEAGRLTLYTIILAFGFAVFLFDLLLLLVIIIVDFFVLISLRDISDYGVSTVMLHITHRSLRAIIEAKCLGPHGQRHGNALSLGASSVMAHSLRYTPAGRL
ncbi:hypothetical protein PG985_014428 [Apiospora marii]|uniref:uncharacterized protein n=1 Tax=Apiospora marii TaxID=335849 RepID=UPI0031316702